jgi:hypothetical protein
MGKVAKILKNIRYQGYISFESLSHGDPKEIVTEMFRSFEREYSNLG